MILRVFFVLKETIQMFSEKLAEVDVMVRRMIMESFVIDNYIDEHLNSTNYRLRLMKYIAPPDVDSNVAAGATANVHDGVNINANVDDDVGAGDCASDNANVDVAINVIANVHIDDDDDADANGNVDANDGADANTGDCASVNKTNADVGIDANASANDGVSVTVDNDVNGDANDVNGDTNAVVGANVNGGTDAHQLHADASAGEIVEAEVEEKKLGLHSHTDKNLITIVYQHEGEGLEVKTKDGKWIRLKISPFFFSVMAGDSLYVSFQLFIYLTCMHKNIEFIFVRSLI